MAQTVSEYVAEEDVHTIFTFGLMDPHHRSPFDESLSTFHAIQSSSLFSSSNSSPVASACCLDSLLSLSCCWVVLIQLSPAGPSSPHAARTRTAVRPAADAIPRRPLFRSGGGDGRDEGAEGRLAVGVGKRGKNGHGDDRDQSRGRSGLGGGCLVECGLATPGMGPQQGNLRTQFALRSKRDLFESISSIRSLIRSFTPGSSATRYCFQ